MLRVGAVLSGKPRYSLQLPLPQVWVLLEEDSSKVQVKAPRNRQPSLPQVREKFLGGEMAVREEGLQRNVLWLAVSLPRAAWHGPQ